MLLFQRIPSSKMKISFKLALHHDKSKPLSHTVQNTDRTMHLSNIYTPSFFCYDKHKKNFDIQISMKRHETV